MMGIVLLEIKPLVTKVPMTNNRMFPLKVYMVERCALMTSADSNNETRLWHLCYGHLNINKKKLLSQKEMVFGPPKLDNLGFCENCVYGKQSKKPFPVGKAWRPLNVLN